MGECILSRDKMGFEAKFVALQAKLGVIEEMGFEAKLEAIQTKLGAIDKMGFEEKLEALQDRVDAFPSLMVSSLDQIGIAKSSEIKSFGDTLVGIEGRLRV